MKNRRRLSIIRSRAPYHQGTAPVDAPPVDDLDVDRSDLSNAHRVGGFSHRIGYGGAWYGTRGRW